LRPHAAAPASGRSQLDPGDGVAPKRAPGAVEEALPPRPVGRSPGSIPIETLFEQARRALARGDHDAALALAERAVERAGGLQAAVVAPHAGWLCPLYEQVLGDRSRTVRVGGLPTSLDARSAFLLSRVDGTFSVDDLLDISGMDRTEATRLVAILVRRGALDVD